MSWFSDVFRGYRERSVTVNELKSLKKRNNIYKYRVFVNECTQNVIREKRYFFQLQAEMRWLTRNKSMVIEGEILSTI